MAIVVIFDESTNAVKQFLASAHTPDYDSRSDVLVNPDVSALSGVPIKYWKHSAGQVVEMTAQEKASVDAEILAAFDLDIRTGAKAKISGFSVDPILLRALADIVKDEINILRERDRDRAVDVEAATSLADLKTRWAARSSLADRTLTQLKTAIEGRIDSRTIDEK